MYRRYLPLQLLLPLLFVLTPAPASAQKALFDAEVPVLTMPPLDNAKLLREAQKSARPDMRFAAPHKVSVRPEREGIWTEQNGVATWRLRIRSTGAYTLNLGFSEFNLPAGAEFFLNSATGEQLGPFTPADNRHHNSFWSPLVDGEELELELHVPTELRKQVQLYLTSVNHDFRNVRKSLSGSCNIDVVCGAAEGLGFIEDYRDVIRSVGGYTLRGIDQCSGFLVNNTSQDGTPLFMTADHCLVTSETEASVVIYWNYQNTTCRTPDSPASGGPGDGQRNISNRGVRVLATSGESDFTITELADPINPDADAYLAGWDARDILPEGPVVSVHHPRVEEKRISISRVPTRRVQQGGRATVPTGPYLEVVSWSEGTTEGGSSGAPLFNAEARVIGQLFGGQASCSNDSYDVYGFLATSWEGRGTPATRLRDWLDPTGSGQLVLDGIDLSAIGAVLSSTDEVQRGCIGETFTIDVTIGRDFPSGTRLSVVDATPGLPYQLSTTTAEGGQRITVTVPTEGAVAGDYRATLRAEAGEIADDLPLLISLIDDRPNAPTLIGPAPQEAEVNPRAVFTWEPVLGASGYDLQLSTDANFEALVFNGQFDDPGLVLQVPLEASTRYFWRVRSFTQCGIGPWSATAQFTTTNLACGSFESERTPLAITTEGTPTVIARLNFDRQIDAADLERLEVSVGIQHTYIGDLRARLQGPNGVQINLFNPRGGKDCGARNLYATFTTQAERSHEEFENDCEFSEAGNYTFFQPAENFAALLTGGTQGEWQLIVNDEADLDGGEIQEFSISTCAVVDISATTDFGIGRRVTALPNPARGLAYLRTEGFAANELHALLTDGTGRTVRDLGFLPGDGSQRIDLRGLAAGVYYLRFTDGRHVQADRLIVLP